jgi:hypothetical protein
MKKINSKILHLLTISICTLGLASCKKIINIDIKNAQQQLVIEGNISNLGNDATVLISKTQNFSTVNAFNGVSNASVVIADNIGNVDTLFESSPGVYKSTKINGIPGNEYSLKVITNGQTYTAVSKMPQLVKLDTIIAIKSSFGGGTNNLVIPIYKDTKDVKNYYRFIETINSDIQKTVFIYDDQYNDGLYAQRPIFNPLTDVKTGDTVKIDLLNITSDNFLYWFSLEQNQTTTPSNPVNNISNGALGYFSAHSISSNSIIVP